MKLRKYSAFVFGAVASIMLVACSGGNGNVNQQTLTPMSTRSASVKALTAETGATANLQSIAKGNGVYVAVGDGGAILTSTDGQKWSSVSAGVGINIHAITYNNTKKLFYAVGDNSIVLSSANGTSWTRYQTLNPVKNLYSIMSVNSDLIIGAESSTIYEIDTNGRGSITVRGTVDSMKLISSTYGNGVMVLGSDDGSILYKSASNMGANWNRATKFSGMSINGLSFESTDGWFLAATSTGKVIQAESNMIWSTPLAISNSSINSVILDDKSNYFFAVGGSVGNAVMLISDDYNSWTPATLPVSKAQLNNVKCFDSNECFIVGDSGTILYGLQRGSDLLPTWGLVGGPDITAPTVSIISPQDKSTGISKDALIQVKFSEPVNNVTNANVSLHSGSPTGPELTIDSIVGSANNSYTIDPGSTLADYTTYYIVIGNGITDLAGNPLLATNFSFTTGDVTPPAVYILNPIIKTGVPKSPVIQIRFSEVVKNVNSTNVSLHVGSTTGATVALGNIIAESYNIYSFSPSVALADTTTYYLVVSSGITDVSGNTLTATNFSFTTGDSTAPTVVMATPTNNTTRVSINPTIKLQFSEAVKNVTSTNITLRESSVTGTVVALSAIIAESNNIYSFSPSISLKNSTVYYLVVDAGITDNAGNALAKSQFNFTTAGTTYYSAYIANAGNKSYTQCEVNSDNGNLIECNTLSAPLNGSLGLTVSNGYVYIMNMNDNTYTQCAINSEDGSLAKCHIAGDTKVFSYPFHIAINNGFAYVTNNSGSYTQCAIDKTDGSLTGCNKITPSSPGILSTPNQITISNKYAYILNYGNNSYTKCAVNSTNGNLTSCTTTVMSLFSSPQGMVINNGYVYVTNKGSVDIIRCSVGATDGAFSGCVKLSTGLTSLFGEDAAIKGGYLYLTSGLLQNLYGKCKVNSDGSLSECNTVQANGLIYPSAIAFN